ncbi:MAG: hypothetical protein M3N08_05990 [Pseudomonadota bacterium]|nr:hypothetical protein [Pseudomonadota bacterium]
MNAAQAGPAVLLAKMKVAEVALLEDQAVAVGVAGSGTPRGTPKLAGALMAVGRITMTTRMSVSRRAAAKIASATTKAAS